MFFCVICQKHLTKNEIAAFYLSYKTMEYVLLFLSGHICQRSQKDMYKDILSSQSEISSCLTQESVFGPL